MMKQIELMMEKPVCMGYVMLELILLLLYQNSKDVLQSTFGHENIQLYYMDADCFILSLNTKDIINDLKFLEKFFDFSKLNKEHSFFSIQNKFQLNFK